MFKLEVQFYNFNSLYLQLLFPKGLIQIIRSILVKSAIFSYLYY